MNRFRQVDFCLIVLAAHFFLAGAAGAAPAPSPERPFAVATNLPPLPQPSSPVSFFRRLLAMSPEQQERFLTNKSPEIRARLSAKINEYEQLDPAERELRLRATELRWYLMPLLQASPTNRAAQLALVPDELRPLVRSRLMQWDLLPPPLQQEFLENERALRYFSHLDADTAGTPGNWHSEPTDAETNRWNALTEQERGRIAAQFNQFFELTPGEKQKTLGALSETERQQMERTLAAFAKLPPAQRIQCIHGFTKFAQMSAADRAQFLRNAEHWAQMSPADRQAWRDLVANVPRWPPVPESMLMPPKPPRLPRLHPVATNSN